MSMRSLQSKKQSEEMLNHKFINLLRHNMITFIKIDGDDHYFYQGWDCPVELYGIREILMHNINSFYISAKTRDPKIITEKFFTVISLLHLLMASRLIYEESNKTISTASFFKMATEMSQIAHEDRSPTLFRIKL